jgi:hypothetical protein
MRVEILYLDGCPSYARFAPRLHELLAGAGVDAEPDERLVDSPEAAVAERFLGSPTVRIDGVDVEQGADSRCDYGLKCRLYSTSEGLHGTPPDDWVLEAINRARGGDDGDGHRAG